MKKIKYYALLVIVTLFFSGCSSVVQKSVIFNNNDITTGSKVVGIIGIKNPEVSVAFPGADCLLCIGVAMASHGVLRDHAKTLNSSELTLLQNDLVKKLNAKGYTVKVLDKSFDISKVEKNNEVKEGYSKYNFSSFAKEGVNSILVLNIKEVGFKRAYQSYVPTEPMKAQIVADGYMVNVSDNKLLWFKEYKLSKGVVGEWNVEPKFPLLTNSFYSLIEEFKDTVISEFN